MQWQVAGKPEVLEKEPRHFLSLVLGWESGKSLMGHCVRGIRVNCSVRVVGCG